MANRHLGEVIQFLRRARIPGGGEGRTDGQLLGDYLDRRDEAALGALVRRHGPMVWGVCLRTLPLPAPRQASTDRDTLAKAWQKVVNNHNSTTFTGVTTY